MRRTRVLSIALAAIILFSETTSFQGERWKVLAKETETDITSELYGTALVSGNVLSADVTESYYTRASLWEEGQKTGTGNDGSML